MTARKLKRAAKAKAAPRRKATKPPSYGIGILDALNDQILFADGLTLAILGLADLSGIDGSALSQLAETHLKELRSIADSFEEFRREAVS
jgi:hypothetical protein